MDSLLHNDEKKGLVGVAWSYRRYILMAWAALVLLGVFANVGLAINRRVNPPVSIAHARIARAQAACPLKCGSHGVCQFRNQDEQKDPACLCDVSYGTFPEKLCGFDTASTNELQSGVNVTVSKCAYGNGRVFTNPDGPCSYKRVGMVNVACASWLGGGLGAAWFLMVDVHGCKQCTVANADGSNSRSIPFDGGYGAAGFFGLLTADYLTIGWWVNSIRILVSRDSSIPFWDALGFLHSDTINGNLING